jgi:hypothetical protein
MEAANSILISITLPGCFNAAAPISACREHFFIPEIHLSPLSGIKHVADDFVARRPRTLASRTRMNCRM